MKAIPNSVMFLRLAAMLVVCWGGPLLCHYLGPAVGALGALGAATLWHSQYRLPTWKERRGASFGFVATGYGIISITLVVCLGRLIERSLL